MTISDISAYLLPTTLGLGLLLTSPLAFARAESTAEPAPELDMGQCDDEFDIREVYPPLPPAIGADLGDEALAQVHLMHERGVIELSGCLYEVDRPLRVDFARYEAIELVFELDDDSGGGALQVSDGLEFELLDAAGGELNYTLELNGFGELGFGLVAPPFLPDVPAPVSPVIRVEPVSGTPEPK